MSRPVSARGSACAAVANAPAPAQTPPGLTKKVVTGVAACAGAALADPLMSLVRIPVAPVLRALHGTGPIMAELELLLKL